MKLNTDEIREFTSRTDDPVELRKMVYHTCQALDDVDTAVARHLRLAKIGVALVAFATIGLLAMRLFHAN